MKLSPEYIAGFVDGEGYIGLYPHYKYKHSFNCAIKIAQTEKSKAILEAIHEQFGGHLSYRNSKTSRPSWMWEIKGKRLIKNFLQTIYPFLVVKKPQATLLLEYCEMSNIHPNYKNYGNGQNERRTQIYEELKKLNYRGLATTE